MSGGLSNGALPGCGRTTVGPIRRGGAPDRGERLLHRILGAAAIAKPPQRKTEHGPCEAPVELLERLAVALAGPPDQLAVLAPVDRARGSTWLAAALSEASVQRLV